MLKQERQRLILQKLKTTKKVNFGELGQLLNVSYDSIRRDVIELQDKGFLKKVHGGIIANSYFEAQDNNKKELLASKELDIIVAKAKKLFENKQLVLMDGGITNFHIATALPKTLETTIVTNSPALALALNGHHNIEVILLGGHYFKKYQISMGIETIRQLRSFSPDIFFMGINGICLENGITVRNHEESLLKQEMMNISKNVVSCVIEEKINLIENFKVSEAQDLDYLITNLKPNSLSLSSLANIPLRIL